MPIIDLSRFEKYQFAVDDGGLAVDLEESIGLGFIALGVGAVDGLFSFFDVALENVIVGDVLAAVLGEGEPVTETVHDLVLFALNLEELVSESCL